MTKIENNWMDSNQPVQSTQDEPAQFERKRGFATRAMSFLGEVLTGKVKQDAQHVRDREISKVRPRAAEDQGHSTLSPYRPPPPALTPDQREAERTEQTQRQMLYLALKQLLDREPGRRQIVKPLWAVEQNIKGLGVNGLDGMAPHMLRTAFLQLDALANYPENGVLWKLRDILVASNAMHGPEVDGQEATPIADSIAWKHRGDRPFQQSQPIPLVSSTVAAGSGKIALQQRKVLSAQVNEVENDGFFAPSIHGDGVGGMEITEAHNLEPFVSVAAPTFELDFDMDLPALRQK